MQREIPTLLIVALLVGMAAVAIRVVDASPQTQQPRSTPTVQPTITSPGTGGEEEERTIRESEIITGTVLPEGESEPEDTSNARTLTVVGTGEVTAVPDAASINLGVETVGDNAREALDENNQRVQSIRQVISELGIPDESVQTSEFSIFVEQPEPGVEGEPSPGTPPDAVRYRVSQSVRVEIEDVNENMQLLGDLIERAVDAGANNLFGPSFHLREDRSIQEQAQRAAVDDAFHRAQNWATLTGVELAGVARIQEVSPDGEFPIPVTAAEGAGGAPLEPGRLTATQRVEIVFYIR